MNTITKNIQREANCSIKIRILCWLWIPLVLLFSCSQPYEFQGTVYDPPRDAPPIVGTNWDGTDFTLEDLNGKIAVLFFGYTNCPDICPMTLAEMQRVAVDLDQKADKVSFVFITVDLENDTLERLAQYVPTFNEDFYGVYMSESALEEIKKGYGVYSALNANNPYIVDHTGGVYIIDKTRQLRLLYGSNASAEIMMPDIQHLLAQ